MSEIWVYFSAFFESESNCKKVFKGLSLASEKKWDEANSVFTELDIPRMFAHTKKRPFELHFEELDREGKSISVMALNMDADKFFRFLNKAGGKRISIDIDNSQTGDVFSYGLINGRRVGKSKIIKSLAEDIPHFALVLAIQQGKEKAAIKLIEEGVDPHTSVDGFPALSRAVMKNKFGLVQVLLNAGADVAATPDEKKVDPDDLRDTALHLSLSMNANTPTTLKIVKALLARGADPNVRDSRGRTPLHIESLSADRKFVQVLLDAGADINALDDKGESPLIKLVQNEKTKPAVLNFFIEKGADLKARDAKGANALWHAAGNWAIEAALENRRLPLERPEDAYEGNAAIDLKRAITHNDMEKFERLLAEGVDVDTEENWDVKSNWTPLTYCALDKRPHMALRLIEAGADVNAAGGAALKWAARENSLEVAEILIDNGADVLIAREDKTDSFSKKIIPGRDAMLHALERKSVDVAALLMRRGWTGDTARLNLALCNAAEIPGTPGIIEALVEKGAEPNTIEDRYVYVTSNAVMKAACFGRFENLETLIRLGGEATIVDKSLHSTPLHAAASLIKGADAIELLINAGADVNAPDINGATPILLAASDNRAANAKLLLQHGADLSVRDKTGKSIHYYAKGKKTFLNWLKTAAPEASARDRNPLGLNRAVLKRETVTYGETICLYSTLKKTVTQEQLARALKSKGWCIHFVADVRRWEPSRGQSPEGSILGARRQEEIDRIVAMKTGCAFAELSEILSENKASRCDLEVLNNWSYDYWSKYDVDGDWFDEALPNLDPQLIDFLCNAKSGYYMGCHENPLSMEFAYDLYRTMGEIASCVEVNWENYQYGVVGA